VQEERVILAIKALLVKTYQVFLASITFITSILALQVRLTLLARFFLRLLIGFCEHRGGKQKRGHLYLAFRLT
jgi:hypothetical protein